jgi:pimeloyl-ACP methyl ester carboxylesterase
MIPQPHPLYGPAASTSMTPYPSNRYAVPDATTATGLRLAIGPSTTADPLVSAIASTVTTLDELDGFSTLGGVAVNFTDDLDPASYTRDTNAYAAAGTPMALVDVDPSSPDQGAAVGLVPRYISSNDDPNATGPEFTLIAEPATPLRPKTMYAFVLSDAIKTTAGIPLVAAPDTVALLTADAEGDYGASVRAALPVVQSSVGIDPSHVVLATVFTTETVFDAVLAVAADRRAAAPPTLSDTLTVTETGTGVGGDDRVRFAGHFPAPDYRAAKPDGHWHVGAGGMPAVTDVASLEFFLNFSDSTYSGPRPVVIFQHGLGSDKDSTWGTTQRLASLNVAVIGIDAPEHGSRATPPFPPGQTDLVTASENFFGIDLTDGGFDVAIARDNFRQMACDQLSMLRFIQTLGTLDVLPVGAPDGKPDIDPTRVLYLGHSFGSVMGATFNALAPEVRATVWNVGGAGLAMLFEDSGLFSLLTKSLEPPGLTKGELSRFFSTIQGIVDPGDAANYAPHVTMTGLPGVPNWQPKDVLIEEVIGDTIVPNSSAERYARAAGLAQVQTVAVPIGGLPTLPAPMTGNLPGGATGGIYQFTEADGAPTDHGSLIFTNDAIAQYTTFFAGSLAGGHGTVQAQGTPAATTASTH